MQLSLPLSPFNCDKRWKDRLECWRRPGDVFDPRGFGVDVISDAVARVFVEQHHYAGSLPPTRLCVGLFRKPGLAPAHLVGAAVFSIPMQAAVIPLHSWQDGTLGVLGWQQPAGTVTAQAEATTGRFSVADPRTTSTREGTGYLGSVPWSQPSGTITGDARPSKGGFTVADPRVDGHRKSVQMGVRQWTQPSCTVTGDMWPGCGPTSVADPRAGIGGETHKNVYRVVRWTQAAGTITGGHGPSSGGQAVSDPRCGWNAGAHQNKLAVTAYDRPARTVTAAGGHGVASGMQCVADPRPRCLNAESRDGYLTQGHYGVRSWCEPSGAVPAFAKNNNGSWSVADPRVDQLPSVDERLVAMIIAEDGTWHRPFTTLELAALQTMFDPEELFEQVDGAWRCRQERPWVMAGRSDSVWREHIGNAVPADSAAAIATVMGTTLLLAATGQTFTLSNEPIWVSPLAWAVSLPAPLEMMQ